MKVCCSDGLAPLFHRLRGRICPDTVQASSSGYTADNDRLIVAETRYRAIVLEIEPMIAVIGINP